MAEQQHFHSLQVLLKMKQKRDISPSFQLIIRQFHRHNLGRQLEPFKNKQMLNWGSFKKIIIINKKCQGRRREIWTHGACHTRALTCVFSLCLSDKQWRKHGRAARYITQKTNSTLRYYFLYLFIFYDVLVAHKRRYLELPIAFREIKTFLCVI